MTAEVDPLVFGPYDDSHPAYRRPPEEAARYADPDLGLRALSRHGHPTRRPPGRLRESLCEPVRSRS